MKLLLLPLITVLISASAVAKSSDDRCPEEIYAAVQRYLRIDSFLPRDQGGTIAAKSCKSWPYDKTLLLAVLAYDDNVEYEKSLVVAVLDRKALRVAAGYRGTISEDAVTEAGVGSLQLDTAKYQLSPDLRAFGVRFSSSARGPSCADGASWDELTLFVQQKGELRPVLRQEMQFQNALRGCIGSAAGHDVWEYGSRSLSVVDTKTNGLSDLLIIETITVDGNLSPMPKDIDAKKRTRSYLMKYDGKEYR